MIRRLRGASSDRRRSTEAARWYVTHESESELSPATWQEWERWSADPDNSAEYDEFVRLHRHARSIARPTLPSNAEVAADAPRQSLSSGSVGYLGHRALRPVAAAISAGIVLVVLAAATLALGYHFGSYPAAAASQGPALLSERTLQELRASGRPVLVNLRAAWCPICVANERTALARETVRQMMRRKGIAYLECKWTHDNAGMITATLRHFGRGGVPLYLLYRPGSGEPEILPQVLTEDIVLSALARIPDANKPRT